MGILRQHSVSGLSQRNGESFTKLNFVQEERLPDLASSLRRLVGKGYLEVFTDLQDSLAKDQFIDALEDREIQMKIRESTPKTLDEAIVEPCRSRQCTRLGLSAQKVDWCD